MLNYSVAELRDKTKKQASDFACFFVLSILLFTFLLLKAFFSPPGAQDKG